VIKSTGAYRNPESDMHVHHRTSLIFVLLVCTFAAVAQEQPVTKIVDPNVAKLEQTVLQKAEEQEEATEHAIISHEKAPAALEDVDEFKGGFAHVMFNMLLCTICWSSTTSLFR
jgi:ABC-type transport system involved in cytochrome bd biosynthesis fused ATPase/permease subunit